MPMAELIYRDEDHTYWLDGQEIPSVSQVLQDMGFSGSPFYTEASATKGRAIHAATKIFDEGGDFEGRPLSEILKEPGDTEAGIKGYLQDYAAFREKHPGFKWFMIEEPSANEVMRYGATPDRIVLDEDNEECVLDIKSGLKAAWHPLQLAAYDFTGTARRYALYLADKPGSFKLIQYKNKEDYTAWNYAIWLWHWRAKYL